MTLKNIADGKEMPVNLPPNAQIISPNWSADGKYIAAGNITPTGIELWIIETATAKAKKIKNVQVNTAFGGFDWMPDQKILFVNLVPTEIAALRRNIKMSRRMRRIFRKPPAKTARFRLFRIC